MKLRSLIFTVVILFFIPSWWRLIWSAFLSNTTRERIKKKKEKKAKARLLSPHVSWKATCFENLSFFFQLLNSSFLQTVIFFHDCGDRWNDAFLLWGECVYSIHLMSWSQYLITHWATTLLNWVNIEAISFFFKYSMTIILVYYHPI